KGLHTGSHAFKGMPLEMLTWTTSTWKPAKASSLFSQPTSKIFSQDHSLWMETADKGWGQFHKDGKSVGQLLLPDGVQLAGSPWLSPAGRFCLLRAFEGKAFAYLLFEVPSGKLLGKLPNFRQWAFAPGERFVVLAPGGDRFEVYDTETV